MDQTQIVDKTRILRKSLIEFVHGPSICCLTFLRNILESWLIYKSITFNSFIRNECH